MGAHHTSAFCMLGVGALSLGEQGVFDQTPHDRGGCHPELGSRAIEIFEMHAPKHNPFAPPARPDRIFCMIHKGSNPKLEKAPCHLIRGERSG